MELFDKVYSCYYNTIRHILTEASGRPLSLKEMEELCQCYGFQETALAILPKLTDGTWPLLEEYHDKKHPCDSSGYKSVLGLPPPKLPLTGLQRAWISALLHDPRFRLFFTDQELLKLSEAFGKEEPLYRQEDFHYYDQFRDGDSYEHAGYREHFQTILKALQEQRPLLVAYEGKKGAVHSFETAPYQLQYSSKDDKFRLCCLLYSRGRYRLKTLLNLERIRDCHLSPETLPASLLQELPSLAFRPVCRAREPVLIRISGQRNSLERCMLHFASYEKHTEYNEEEHCWLCSIYYDQPDETELLIDILSFGPVIQVLGPESFLRQVRQRVRKQHELFYSNI